MSTLKQELKTWEAQFKAQHGRNPTKDDIKQQPDIAAKYKQYNKSKTQPPSASASSSRASTSTAKPPSSSSSRPPQPDPVFKTPTKPKPSRSRPADKPIAEPSTSSDALSAPLSPSKRPTSSSTSTSSASKPAYVLANSPSKLRALAALHSSSARSSPNRPSGGAWTDAQLAAGLEAVKQVDPVQASRSPQKAKNPFASPQKKGQKKRDGSEDVFGEFEKQERARMKERKRAEREKRKAAGGGGVLGKGATTVGAGWGSAALDGLAGLSSRLFSRTDSRASSAMDVDEVDSFFGSSQPTSQPSSSLFASQLRASQPLPAAAAADDDEDIVLGPSPAKPSASTAFFGLSSSSAAPSKPFKPLFTADSPPRRPPPPPAAAAAAKPKLFATSLRDAGLPSLSASQGQTLKRAASSSALNGGKKPLNGKSEDKDDEDALLDSDDDAFYADALSAAESALGGKGKPAAKRKKAAPPPRVVRGKGKGRQSTAEELEELDDGVTATRGRRGELVLEFDEAGSGEEDGEEGEARRGRVTVRAAGWRVAEAADEGEDGMYDDAAVEEAEDDLVDDVSLLHRRPPPDLLTRLRAHSTLNNPSFSAGSTPAPEGEDDPAARRAALEASLPADLAAVLSLRASPTKPKKHSAKEQQALRVLGEPGARTGGRRKGGLLDLQDEDGEEEWGAGAAEEEEGEGDDDWESEGEGWDAAGEAMDGYYSGDGGEGW
ncbi:hypothetical protein JCM8097_004892 [Rhodosporidiobolus ruineniae]